jgi:signal peptidase I
VTSGEPDTYPVPGSTVAQHRPTRWWPYVVLAVVLVIALRAFVVQSFSVPSGSMEPTIEPGDRILANRLVRGDDLHRGDIVVGALATLARTLAGVLTFDTGTDYVKRVVGLAGDRVVCCDASGRLRVNGVGVDEPYLWPGDRPSDLTFDVLVPPGNLWVMGDHRSASGDSRSYLGRPGGGMVPVGEVIGQATVRYWPPSRLGSLGSPGPLSTIPSPVGAGQ